MNKVIIFIISILLLGTSAFAENQDTRKGVPVFTKKDLKKYENMPSVIDSETKETRVQVRKKQSDVSHKPVLIKPGDPGYPKEVKDKRFKPGHMKTDEMND